MSIENIDEIVDDMADKPVCAIVSEYNPFHNGHKLHIDRTKEIIGDCYIIAVMSGNFTQRGLPSIFDKYIRAKCAIMSGVDLVVELPCVFATQSADIFANGAIKVINTLGICDYISFGSEDGSIFKIEKAAEFFSNPPVEYDMYIREEMSNGRSFPLARAIAYEKITDENGDFLSKSNNILGIEYLKHIKINDLNIKPVTIGRVSSDYNSEKLHEKISSAAAIRTFIKDGGYLFKEENEKNPSVFLDTLENQLPENSFNTIYKCFKNNVSPVFIDHFFDIIRYKIINIKDKYDDFDFFDVDENLKNSIYNNIDIKKYSDFINSVYNKNYTKARVQRALNNILLDIDNEFVKKAISIRTLEYINILGVNRNSVELLKKVGNEAIKNSVKLLSRGNEVNEFLQSGCQSAELLKKDLFASDIYELVYSDRLPYPMDFKRQIMI